MWKNRKIFLSCSLFALLTIASLHSVECSDDDISAAKYTNLNEMEQRNARSGRIMKFLNEPKPVMRRTKLPPRIRSRADNLPSRPLHNSITNNNNNNNNNPLFGRPAQAPPQIPRRVHNGINAAPPQHYQYEPVKRARYSSVKGVLSQNGGKTSAYRYTLPQNANGNAHPNAVHPPPTEQYIQNFKASPTLNGKVIVHQVPEEQPHVQQHPLPIVEAQKQYSDHLPQQQQYLNQREQYPLPGYQSQPVDQTQYPPAAKPYKEVQHEEQHKRPYVNGAANTGYSVYEDEDVNQPQQQQPFRNTNPYHDSTTSVAAQEAKDYLKFMSTNEYFLPIREPNYKQLDAELERIHYQQPQQQQPFIPHSQPKAQQQKPLLKQQQQSQPLLPHYMTDKTNTFNSYNEPIKVSNLFFLNDPAPSSTVVRGSYQTANNIIVVSSDGNRAIKHFIPDLTAIPMPTTPITPSPPSKSYEHMQYNNQQHSRSRTPEPLRFEFTERDAVHSGNTKVPQIYLRYKAVETPTATTTRTTLLTTSEASTTAAPSPTRSPVAHTSSSFAPSFYGNASIKTVSLADDDSDDVHHHQHKGNADSYGRGQLVSGSTLDFSTTEEPNEQKDTEDYCERICANVQEEDEEVVCGSDGYMYTSESQLECYSSCLRIEVTIQGKGSCSAR